jgi:hypothetical protein
VSDSILYSFVRDLLHQSSPNFSAVGDTSIADFYVSKVLLENDLFGAVDNMRYQHALEVSSELLRQLCIEDHLFTAEDTCFIRQQIKYSTGFALDQRFLPERMVITANTVRNLEKSCGNRWYSWKGKEQLQKRYNTNCFSWLSMPLFSRNGQTVILELNYFCPEELGQTWVLQRRKNKWHKVKWLGHWES